MQIVRPAASSNPARHCSMLHSRGCLKGRVRVWSAGEIEVPDGLFFKNNILHSSVHINTSETDCVSQGHLPGKHVTGLLHPIGQSPIFLPDEEVKRIDKGRVTRPGRLHPIQWSSAKPKFRLSSFKRLFQRPRRLSHRIGLCLGHPTLSRPATPYQNPDRRLVKPSPKALSANRFPPALRSVSDDRASPSMDPDGRGKTAPASKASFEGINGYSFSDYKYDNPLL